MGRWIEKIEDRLRRWMRGRYGQDALSRFSLYLTLILAWLSALLESTGLTCLAVALLTWSGFRSCSKNISQRQRELEAYQHFIRKPRNWFTRQKRRWDDRDVYRYYPCKQCGTILRVPKGKGKIEITCPRCHTVCTKKT